MSNVPDDWNAHWRTCSECGGRYHGSEWCEPCHIAELDARMEASKEFHSDSSGAQSCVVYKEMHGDDCPCEDDWKEFLHGS